MLKKMLDEINWESLLVSGYTLFACKYYIFIWHFSQMQSTISLKAPLYFNVNKCLSITSTESHWCIHSSKDFLSKSSNRSFACNKLNFESLNLEMLFYHKACCRLLSIFSRASCCKFFKDCKQGQCWEISSQYALQFSHLILQVLNRREQLELQSETGLHTHTRSVNQEIEGN